MLEIIHDVAPGAKLFFATAFTSIESFADNIRALRAAGCDIIVDDIIYFVESPFHDDSFGPRRSTAVNEVTADGALYFSSAGNEGNLNDGTSGTWEGDFVDGGPTSAPLPAGRLHSFGSQTFNVFTFNGGVMNLYSSIRWAGRATRPVPVEQHGHRRDRGLDEPAKWHTGSVPSKSDGVDEANESRDRKAAGAADRLIFISARSRAPPDSRNRG